jgi:hypothetical protein
MAALLRVMALLALALGCCGVFLPQNDKWMRLEAKLGCTGRDACAAKAGLNLTTSPVQHWCHLTNPCTLQGGCHHPSCGS